MNKYTSLKLSKLLHDNGCKLKSRKAYNLMPDGGFYDNLVNVHSFSKSIIKDRLVLTYDILNDICVKFAKEVFPIEWKDGDSIETPMSEILSGENIMPWQHHSKKVLFLLQQNKEQQAEDYIWENCLFNPKNKQ